jgi:hypothetical protein
MAEKLNIHVAVQNNQTVSKFVVPEYGKVIFHNDASAKLTVEFDEPAALCKGGNPQASIDVDPGNKENLKVCSGTTITSLKYTATVENALPEDPILIIESSSIIGSTMFAVGATAAVALVAGYVLGRNLKVRVRADRA